ncbi:MAG TPA: nucleoside-diphosphate sugar epimerase/dehydratase [Anaerolineae bacterium]|nr:nucleoside-diphosphate sugar epimerase/dehydratase [Anaerolineae bacterium]
MAIVQRLRNRYFFALDVVLLVVAVILSYVLRLDTFSFYQLGAGFLFFTGVVVVVIPLLFYFFGIYSRYWLYASVEELLLLSGATTLGAAISGVIGMGAAWVIPDMMLPRSIPFIFWPLALLVTGAPRFAVRLSAQYARRRPEPRNVAVDQPQRILVVGAGDAGTIVVREMLNNPSLDMDVIGFVDDDPRKRSTRIAGVPVLGSRRAIPQLTIEHDIDLVVIAIPTAPGREVREIISICEKAGVPTKIMPGLYEMLGGTVSVNQLRNVQIEDLLRREPVQTDTEAVQHLIVGKRVLVTGGGGSIGSEICRQILRFGPSDLMVLGHGENSIFDICAQLDQQLAALSHMQGAVLQSIPRVHPVIADIRFPDRIRAVFEQYRPEIVFHAAAHKHVPLMEVNPTEAISNNVLGTRNLLDAAVVTGVERFVMISTDKAVRPKSIMGASKRVAELLVHHTAWEIGRPYVAVRFGNVLGSRGSVLQTFKRQIAAGGPITITHPDMKRYFMTIPEAVQLVLQAAVLGKGGEVFMLDMGEPVKIVNLAQDLIELSGLEVGHDIEIVFTGIRPGEKLYEELFIPGETYRRTEHQKIFVIESATSSVLPSQLNQVVARLEDAAYGNNVVELTDALQRLLPDFDSCSEVAANDRIAMADTTALAGLTPQAAQPLDVSAKES